MWWMNLGLVANLMLNPKEANARWHTSDFRYTLEPVLIAWFEYILPFASEIANLLIAFASDEARKVRFKLDTIAFLIIVNTIGTHNSQLIKSHNWNQSYECFAMGWGGGPWQLQGHLVLPYTKGGHGYHGNENVRKGEDGNQVVRVPWGVPKVRGEFARTH